MKRYVLTIIISAYAFIGLAQDSGKPKTQGEISSDAFLNSLVEKKFKDASGNDRQNWTGMGGAFLNLLGTNGSTDLTLSPTLFTLLHFKKVANNDTNFIDYEYRKQWFARNLQLNIGATPNSKNQIHLDAGNAGFKFAIINNKNASVKDYQSLSNVLDLSDSVNIIMQHYKFVENGKYKAAIETFENNPSKDLIKSLPDALIAQLKLNFKNVKPETLLMPANALQSALTDKLAKKPTLTFSANDSYDFVKSQQNSLTVSSEFTFYLGKVPFDLSANYVWSADTSKTQSTLVRKVFTTAFGKNFKISKSFEVKPAFDYVHTQGPLYEKEHPDTFDASVAPRIKINDQFWLPITIKYDVKHPQLLGFLSVQYSLK